MLRASKRRSALFVPWRAIGRTVRLQGVSLPAYLLLWAMLWANMNTGQWNLRNPQGTMGYVNAARALLPLLAALVALAVVSRRRVRSGLRWRGPVRLLASFGLVSLSASAVSVSPVTAAYWGGLYLSVFIVLEAILADRDVLGRASLLLVLNMAVVVAFTIGILWAGRDVVFDERGEMQSYAINVLVRPVPGLGMVRSSGAGRYAAIGALASLVVVIWGRGSLRVLCLLSFAACVALVLDMQSRGAILGLAVGLGFILYLWKGEVVLLPLAGLLVLAVLARPEIVDIVYSYVSRGVDSEKLMTLTGRTGRWLEGLELFLESPLIGLGPLADRIHMGWAHIHNAWLNALVQGGMAGVAFFVASWVAAWRLFLRNRGRLPVLTEGQRLLFAGSGAVLAFFTVRTVAESTGAFMSPELLMLVSLFAYLEALDRRLRGVAEGQVVQWQMRSTGAQNAPWLSPWAPPDAESEPADETMPVRWQRDERAGI